MSKNKTVGLNIPKPCGANWEEMSGQGAQRHCASCDKDVHHLSMMTRDDAHALLSNRPAEGLCVRYFVADDGVILFADDLANEERPSGRLMAQLSGARRLLAAAAIAAPLLLAACDAPQAPAEPTAQSPLIIQEGKPVTLDPGAAKPPAFKPSEPAQPPKPAEPPAPVVHEVDGGLAAMPEVVEGKVAVEEGVDCESGEQATPPVYKHVGPLPPKDPQENRRMVKGDIAVEHE